MMGAEEIIRLVRAARGLEAGGFYNAAKLLWARAYAEEIRLSNDAGIPRGDDLLDMLEAILTAWRTDGTDAAVIAALEKGRAGFQADQTIPLVNIPAVHVSRTTGELFVGKPPEISAAGDHRLGLREFRPIWYLEPLTPAEVVTALEQNPTVVQGQIAGLTVEQMEIKPASGEWNMRELLKHLLDAQELLAARVDRLLTEDNPSLAGMATWALEKQAESPGAILERYLDSRQSVLAKLKALPLADWWRRGQHSEWGEQTILSQATYFARHEMSHLPQFGEIKAGIAANRRT